MKELRIVVAIVSEVVEALSTIDTRRPPGKLWGAIMETLARRYLCLSLF